MTTFVRPSSVLPSILKACWLCKPSAQIFSLVRKRKEAKSFDVTTGHAQTTPSRHTLNYSWGEHCPESSKIIFSNSYIQASRIFIACLRICLNYHSFMMCFGLYIHSRTQRHLTCEILSSMRPCMIWIRTEMENHTRGISLFLSLYLM